MKKEQLLFVVKVCMYFFATAVLGSYVFYKIKGINEFPLILIEQWLVMDGFLFAGLLFGATDIIIKSKSMTVRAVIVTVVLYIVAMIILSNMVWNPFESYIKFFGTTFLFVCASFVVVSFYTMWRNAQSKRYKKLIEEFKIEEKDDNKIGI